MKLRIATIGLAVAALLVVTAIAALGGGADGEPANLQETTGPDEQVFIGLSLYEAVALAEEMDIGDKLRRPANGRIQF